MSIPRPRRCRSSARAAQRGIQDTFARLLTLAEIETPAGRRRPRIHDLRHTFAVKTLIDWQRDGVDVAAHLPVLSTFLGHSGPEATYWYLQATPELLGQAATRLQSDEQARP
jgi:integrase/recombinase XerD